MGANEPTMEKIMLDTKAIAPTMMTRPSCGGRNFAIERLILARPCSGEPDEFTLLSLCYACQAGRRQIIPAGPRASTPNGRRRGRIHDAQIAANLLHRPVEIGAPVVVTISGCFQPSPISMPQRVASRKAPITSG